MAPWPWTEWISTVGEKNVESSKPNGEHEHGDQIKSINICLNNNGDKNIKKKVLARPKNTWFASETWDAKGVWLGKAAGIVAIGGGSFDRREAHKEAASEIDTVQKSSPGTWKVAGMQQNRIVSSGRKRKRT